MLNVKELNEVQGLLKYLNDNMDDVKPNDFAMVDSNGSVVARLGCVDGTYELLEVPADRPRAVSNANSSC